MRRCVAGKWYSTFRNFSPSSVQGYTPLTTVPEHRNPGLNRYENLKIRKWYLICYCSYLFIYLFLCILIYIQQGATLHSLIISGNCFTCFGRYLHSSSGAHATVCTASGTCQTVTATCRYRGGVGTGASSNSSTIATFSSNSLTSTRCCRYSCMCS